MKRLFDKKLCKRNLKQILSVVLIMIVLLTSLRLEAFIVNADEAESYVTLYLVDNTTEKWVGNDSAVVELVDNTNGHGSYIMTKVDDTTWSASVPESAYNITFNRYNSEKTTQWNSWSAGGRDANNAYYADGSEYGHWEVVEKGEEYFHAGDIVYLDVSGFTEWTNDNALMYVNFTGATKEENGGLDIDIENANETIYNPRAVDLKVEDHIYAYVITFADEGATELRFWRGNTTTLWNNSVKLSYDDYAEGKNCVKVDGWNVEGAVCVSTNELDKNVDNNGNGYSDYLDKITGYGTENYDSDEDGLPDYYEYVIKSNKDCSDSDGDGIPDGYEVFTMQTTPILSDSDNNGIKDSNEDFDADGINNIDEYNLGTNPRSADSDNDGLSDVDERDIYHTKPTHADTDSDGLSDGLEIRYSMDPFNTDTLNNGILDGDRVYDVKIEGECSDNNSVQPTITVELEGNQIHSLSIEKVDSSDTFLNEEIPGYIGNAFECTVDGEFEKAVLSFELDEDLFEDGFVPAIYYCDEENQSLVEVENQSIDGNIISAELEHFSKYIVVAKNIYELKKYEYTILAPTDEELRNKVFDVALVLDESGSISNSDFQLMKNLCGGLVGDFSEEDRIAVFTFDDIVRKRTTFVDKTSCQKTLESINQENGATAIYDGINEAIEEFSNYSNDNATKIMIVLTDGLDNSSSSANTPSNILKKANDENVIIYTVGVGDVDSSVLSELAKLSGGAYYGVTDFEQLGSVFDRLITDADLYKDSDGDGISDYHEKKISKGEMKTGLGVSVNGYAKLDYLNADSDGDGLLDGEELEIKEETASKSTVYCYLNSNPCSVDSDGDGFEDCAEIYIGTDPLNVTNKLSETTGEYTANAWWEWVELTKDHAWNYIHNQVQADARAKNTELYKKELVIPNVGRVDLYRESTKEMWEVKPYSYAEGTKKDMALAQLKKYVDSNEAYKVGGNYVKSSSFVTADNKYDVKYSNLLNGLVVYRFDRKRDEENEYVPVYKEEEEKEQIPAQNFVYQPNITVEDVGFWTTVAGIAIIGTTLVEDVITGGAGIADDGWTIGFALSLMGA